MTLEITTMWAPGKYTLNSQNVFFLFVFFLLSDHLDLKQKSGLGRSKHIAANARAAIAIQHI
jgi:hypothetical protein